LQEVQQVIQDETSQIEKQILKSDPNLVAKYTAVKTLQMISCHSCSPQTEIIVKKFYYTFPNGVVAFFCNEKEKFNWMTKHNKIDQ